MENRKEKNGPTFVPQFGAWDNNGAANAGGGGNGGYTMEFSKARFKKKNQHKTALGGAHHGLTDNQKQDDDPANTKNGYKTVPQFGTWEQQGGGVNKKEHKDNDLFAPPPSFDHEQEALRKQHEDSCTRKKNMLTYLNCCIRR